MCCFFFQGEGVGNNASGREVGDGRGVGKAMSSLTPKSCRKVREAALYLSLLMHVTLVPVEVLFHRGNPILLMLEGLFEKKSCGR